MIPHPWDKDDLLVDAYKRGWSHGHGIALDLLAFDADVCGVSLETLEPFVADWRARNPET